MAKPAAVTGYALTQSEQNPASVTYSVTPTATTAARTRVNGKPLLLGQLALNCTCGGTHPGSPGPPPVPSGTYVGNGAGTIVANTPRVRCENQAMLLEGDNVTVSCTGMITPPSSPPAAGNASVKVAIGNANQGSVRVGD
jgi:hypothetical protein